MSEIIFLVVLVSSFLVIFSKAGECYYCGSRNIHRYSTYKTRGVCCKCKDEAGVLNK